MNRRRKHRIKKAPMAVALSKNLVSSDRALAAFFAGQKCWTRFQVRILLGYFGMTPYEQRFVKQLFEFDPGARIFRCNQQQFCGDFVIVLGDGSPGDPYQLWLLELKQRTNLKLHVDRVHQMRNGDRVAEAIRTQLGVPGQEVRTQCVQATAAAFFALAGLNRPAEFFAESGRGA